MVDLGLVVVIVKCRLLLTMDAKKKIATVEGGAHVLMSNHKSSSIQRFIWMQIIYFQQSIS